MRGSRALPFMSRLEPLACSTSTTRRPRGDERLSAPYAFAVLEPTFDGFRNYLRAGEKLSPETLLVERAFMLNLSAPEMTVLIGGMRDLNANFRQAPHGVFTDRPETLTNDFFVNLLDVGTEWKASVESENVPNNNPDISRLNRHRSFIHARRRNTLVLEQLSAVGRGTAAPGKPRCCIGRLRSRSVSVRACRDRRGVPGIPESAFRSRHTG